MDDRSGKRLNTVIEHITQNQSRPIHVEEMAQICNLSTPAFCRWFKQVFKCSFVTYMTERRIETACRLLETSNLGISIIGDRVGFESYSNFNRAFTKVKQIPPREYRRVHQ
jgi:transcriptional regulator GlxA family with amidase domain